MDQSSKLLVLLVIVCSFAPFTVICSRPLNSEPSISERLKLSEEAVPSCWESLFELQSCTGEIVMFFLNGETFLGHNCCNAIKTIETHCWSSMLGSVGINAEESYLLLGYCDAKDDSGSSGSTVSPPLPPPTLTSSHVIYP